VKLKGKQDRIEENMSTPDPPPHSTITNKISQNPEQLLKQTAFCYPAHVFLLASFIVVFWVGRVINVSPRCYVQFGLRTADGEGKKQMLMI
jgi:hypothetical protein